MHGPSVDIICVCDLVKIINNPGKEYFSDTAIHVDGTATFFDVNFGFHALSSTMQIFHHS